MTHISAKNMQSLLRVYFIMGSTNATKDPREVLKEAIDGGITLFQFREKGEHALVYEEKIQLAKQLQAICKEHNIPFIVNDDVDLAIKLDADGVHIGQDDAAAGEVRKKIGNKILGISAHNLNEVNDAISQGADYLGMGPIFPTKTKADTESVKGTKLIQSVREQGINIPIVGIGGITANNASDVIKGGADGVSVITAISMANSPFQQAKALKEAVNLSEV